VPLQFEGIIVQTFEYESLIVFGNTIIFLFLILRVTCEEHLSTVSSVIPIGSYLVKASAFLPFCLSPVSLPAA
jgi:hypothetical protein